MHSWAALLRSTYWPLQKSAPLGAWQSAWHFGSSTLAVQLAWHWALTSTSHETLHDASHAVWHETEGGWAEQVKSQRLVQSAWQSVTQASSLQPVAQLASHWVAHEALQSNDPGLAVHIVVQEAEQLPVHELMAETVQSASQLATRLPGVHLASHPPEVST
jgi:hypothetical protein